MAKVKSGDVMQLHYALTESECSDCGSHLQWKLDLKDISRPRYVSHYCNYQYVICVDNVKIDVTRSDRKQKQENDEPRAILIAQTKKKARHANEYKS